MSLVLFKPPWQRTLSNSGARHLKGAGSPYFLIFWPPLSVGISKVLPPTALARQLNPGLGDTVAPALRMSVP
jgi:hypothetical protein